MGLDIRAFSKLKRIDAAFDDEGEPIDPVTCESVDYDLRVYINPDFPGRCNLADNGIYTAEANFCFCAGSYGWYNRWRDELARIAGYPAKQVDRYGSGRIETRYDQSAFEADGGPFWELIWFSDCEGIIGSEIAKKLHNDFIEFQAKADASPELGFRERYANWRKAFELAADDGAVEFH